MASDNTPNVGEAESHNLIEGEPHDPIGSEFFRLGEVVNLPRGATTDLVRDWPPPQPWKRLFRELKAAVEHEVLQVGPRSFPVVNKLTLVSVKNLWLFAVGRSGRWEWLRRFCRLEADAAGLDLDKPAPPDRPAKPRGRPRGSGAYNDNKHLEEMKKLLQQKDGAKSPHQAAVMVVRNSRVKGVSVAAKIDRLRHKFAELDMK